MHGSGSGSNSNGVIGSSDSGVGVFGNGGAGFVANVLVKMCAKVWIVCVHKPGSQAY